MYNFISKIPLSIGEKTKKIDLEIPEGKYIKFATICLVKYNSSHGVAHVLCQLGNTKQEQKNKASICYGLDKKTNEITYANSPALDGNNTKIWAYDAVCFSSNTMGYVYLEETTIKATDLTENKIEE